MRSPEDNSLPTIPAHDHYSPLVGGGGGVTLNSPVSEKNRSIIPSNRLSFEARRAKSEAKLSFTTNQPNNLTPDHSTPSQHGRYSTHNRRHSTKDVVDYYTSFLASTELLGDNYPFEISQQGHYNQGQTPTDYSLLSRQTTNNASDTEKSIFRATMQPETNEIQAEKAHKKLEARLGLAMEKSLGDNEGIIDITEQTALPASNRRVSVTIGSGGEIQANNNNGWLKQRKDYNVNQINKYSLTFSDKSGFSAKESQEERNKGRSGEESTEGEEMNTVKGSSSFISSLFAPASMLEQRFLSYYFYKYSRATSVSILAGVIIWGLFILNDWSKNNQGRRSQFQATVILRGVDCAVGLLCAAVLRLSCFRRRKIMQSIVFFTALLFGVSQTIFGIFEKDSLDPTYSVILILLPSMSATVLRQRFHFTVFYSVLMILIYFILTLVYSAYTTLDTFILTIISLIFGNLLFALHAYKREYRIRKEFLSQMQLARDERRSEQLLSTMLPLEAIEKLRAGHEFIYSKHEEVSVLFSHIVDFDTLTSKLLPIELVKLLNEIFSRFDAITDHYGVYKVETIGDVYLCCTNCPSPQENHAALLCICALHMNSSLSSLTPVKSPRLQLKIGLHSGPVIAGVIGVKYPRYRLCGDTVNTASRMSTNSLPGRIQLSQATATLINHEKTLGKFELESRGAIPIKGKGQMNTFMLISSSFVPPGDQIIPILASKEKKTSQITQTFHAKLKRASMRSDYSLNSIKSASVSLVSPNNGSVNAENHFYSNENHEPPQQRRKGSIVSSKLPTGKLNAIIHPVATTAVAGLEEEIRTRAAQIINQPRSFSAGSDGTDENDEELDGEEAELDENEQQNGIPSAVDALPDHSNAVTVVDLENPEETAANLAFSSNFRPNSGALSPDLNVVSLENSGSKQFTGATAVVKNSPPHRPASLLVESFRNSPSHSNRANKGNIYNNNYSNGSNNQHNNGITHGNGSGFVPLSPSKTNNLGTPQHQHKGSINALRRISNDGVPYSLHDLPPQNSPHRHSSTTLNHLPLSARLTSIDNLELGPSHENNGQNQQMFSGGEENNARTPSAPANTIPSVPANTIPSALKHSTATTVISADNQALKPTKLFALGSTDSILYSKQRKLADYFSLNFASHPVLEAAFQAAYFHRFLGANRNWCVAAVLMLLPLSIYDTINAMNMDIDYHITIYSWVVRVVGLIAGSFYAFYAFRANHMKPHHIQLATSLMLTLLGFVYISITLMLDTASKSYGIGAMLLLLTVIQMFAGLRFLYAFLSSYAMLIYYVFGSLITFGSIPGPVLLLVAGNLIYTDTNYNAEMVIRKDFVRRRKQEIEKARTRQFLDLMLPISVLESINRADDIIVNERHNASVLFADIVGFTSLASRLDSIDVVAILNVMFATFDALSNRFDVYKVETIGDCYFACTGVLNERIDSARNMCEFALAMLHATQHLKTPDQHPIQLRVGIHTGFVIAGVVGRKMPRYHLFSNTVTIAEEMEQHGLPNNVCISEITKQQLGQAHNFYEFEQLAPLKLNHPLTEHSVTTNSTSHSHSQNSSKENELNRYIIRYSRNSRRARRRSGVASVVSQLSLKTSSLFHNATTHTANIHHNPVNNSTGSFITTNNSTECFGSTLNRTKDKRLLPDESNSRNSTPRLAAAISPNTILHTLNSNNTQHHPNNLSLTLPLPIPSTRIRSAPSPAASSGGHNNPLFSIAHNNSSSSAFNTLNGETNVNTMNNTAAARQSTSPSCSSPIPGSIDEGAEN
jgi:class 3 adenylate cyclase